MYIIITFFVIWPTSIGAKNPAVFAKQLVIPIKVPEKFGAISIWLQLIDINEAPLKPTQTHRRATTAYLWQPAYRIKINANAGIIKAENIHKLRYYYVVLFFQIGRNCPKTENKKLKKILYIDKKSIF